MDDCKWKREKGIVLANFPTEKGFIAEPKFSPFNYDEHAMIYYTEDMPHPSHERKKFIEKGIDEIVRILEISKGKALILFTAKNDMVEVYERLKDRVPYRVLMQNGSASQSDTIAEFKKDVNSVLLGTGTYWEGISKVQRQINPSLKVDRVLLTLADMRTNLARAVETSLKDSAKWKFVCWNRPVYF